MRRYSLFFKHQLLQEFNLVCEKCGIYLAERFLSEICIQKKIEVPRTKKLFRAANQYYGWITITDLVNLWTINHRVGQISVDYRFLWNFSIRE